jgi:RAQPRD family integrative conjugative element protein
MNKTPKDAGNNNIVIKVTTMTFIRLKNTAGQRCKKWLILITMLACSVQASNDLENKTLARLLVELQVLEILISASEAQATNGDRQQFDYAALRRDIALITQGVKDHLLMTRRDPRALPAVEGEYRQ